MKVGIATTLSIAGVLAAGAAAYAVNSSVLSTSSSVSATASGTPVVDAVNTLPAQVVEKSTKVQSSVLNNTTTTYQVGTSGSVVLDMRSGAIAVSNVLPAAGWTSEPAQVQPNGDVRVPFVSSTARIEFLARLVDGKVVVSVTAQPIAPPSTMKPAANPPKPPYSDDDDHDDDDDDDDDEEHENERKKDREHEEDEDDD
jgi:ribosomal protein L12E/L44/L45/RPP1/RPP2